MEAVFLQPMFVTQKKIAKMVRMRWIVSQVRNYGPHWMVLIGVYIIETFFRSEATRLPRKWWYQYCQCWCPNNYNLLKQKRWWEETKWPNHNHDNDSFHLNFTSDIRYLMCSSYLKSANLTIYHFVLTNHFQPHLLLFMKKASLTISPHFNMQSIVTCAPRSAIKIIVVVPKMQVRVHSIFEF